MDHWVDRPEVQARQRAQPTGTNRPTRTTHTHTPTHPHQRPSAPGRAANQTPRPLRSPEPTHPTPPHAGGRPPGPRTTTPPPSRRPQRAGKRPDPYRTRKLSPPAPMVLPPPGSGRVGHHRNTHQPTGPRGVGAPTRRPPHAGQTHTHTLTTQRRLFSGLMVALSCADHLRCAGPRRSDPRSRGRKCTSRRPGRSGAGHRGPRDRRVTAEHVT